MLKGDQLTKKQRKELEDFGLIGINVDSDWAEGFVKKHSREENYKNIYQIISKFALLHQTCTKENYEHIYEGGVLLVDREDFDKQFESIKNELRSFITNSDGYFERSRKITLISILKDMNYGKDVPGISEE